MLSFNHLQSILYAITFKGKIVKNNVTELSAYPKEIDAPTKEREKQNKVKKSLKKKKREQNAQLFYNYNDCFLKKNQSLLQHS